MQICTKHKMQDSIKFPLAIFKKIVYTMLVDAGVMELVDVVDSKSTAGDSVPVRVRPPAPKRLLPFRAAAFLQFCIKKRTSIMKNESAKKELTRTLKFVLFSASAGIIQVVSFTLLNELLSLTYWAAYLISLILSVVWNFTLNRKFTFKSANNIPIAMTKVAVYYLVFTPLSTWWTAALTEPAYRIMWNEYLVLVLTMLVNFVTEFLYDRFVVFGKSIDTAVKQ